MLRKKRGLWANYRLVIIRMIFHMYTKFAEAPFNPWLSVWTKGCEARNSGVS